MNERRPSGLIVPDHLNETPVKTSEIPWKAIDWDKVLKGRHLRRVRRSRRAPEAILSGLREDAMAEDRGPGPEPGAKAKARRLRQIEKGTLKPTGGP